MIHTPQPPAFHPVVLLLAAGSSHRMQGRNKLLTKVHKKRIIDKVILAYRLALAHAPIVIVTGYDHDLLQ